ncbi:hypothetical protein [Acidilobus sp. 7A]|jgi:hypothetical protein|uniref:hypothetical protein n=1 Tax=Acidilobus sp. 7A TaxID=1577685 RepID=UPI001B3BBEA8|nr:hypothetical protein [Acidilobus sp. 7A]
MEPATRRPERDEREKPSEPQCRVRVYGGYSAILTVLSYVKEAIYRYNEVASRKGYYLKPVHKVYKRLNGVVRVYEYYGRYWWRKGERRLIYAGHERPRGLPEPPSNPLEGLSVIREGEDIIIDCSLYDDFSWLFKGLRSERVA